VQYFIHFLFYKSLNLIHLDYNLALFKDGTVVTNEFNNLFFPDHQHNLFRIASSRRSPIFFIIFEFNQSCAYQYNLTNQTAFLKFEKFSHSNSTINCFTILNDHYLLLGESNSVIYVYSGNFLQKGEIQKKSITFHSHPITCIDGNSSVNLIASVDSRHNVIYTSLMSCKYIHSFKLQCEERSEHIIKVTRGGIVVILSSFANSSGIQFFDLTGQCLKSIKVEGAIVRIESINLIDRRAFVLIPTSFEVFILISLNSFEQYTIPFSKDLDHRFFFVHPNSLTVSAAKKDGSGITTFSIQFPTL
jgi:hypothetical protein